jgi:hypothetical protein
VATGDAKGEVAALAVLLTISDTTAWAVLQVLEGVQFALKLEPVRLSPAHLVTRTASFCSLACIMVLAPSVSHDR